MTLDLLLWIRSGFTNTVDSSKKHKVPHSYSSAEENASFVDGVRDDERERSYY
jgi:hypothetical protein